MILKTELYEYQKNAVEKLIGLKVGALYMEMGTGKTRTVLELGYQRLVTGKIDKILWLCPCSVVADLKMELVKHTGEVPTEIEICGIETLSSSVRENMRLLEFVGAHRTFIIVDESSLVKNPQAYRTQNITRIASKCPYRAILNGTPVSKNEADLFAQWYLLDWRILGYRSFWSFSANHLEYDDRYPGRVVRTLNVDYMARKIAPYTYQVLKKDCLDLPAKTYQSRYYSMTDEQADHYYHVADKMFFQINEFRPETIYRTFAALQAVIGGMYVSNLSGHLKTTPMFHNPTDNPRIQLLLDTIDQVSGKIVIYCKYTHEILAIINLLCELYGENAAVPFYGGISQKKRQANKELFADSARFLIANKACAAYGLNLQYCSHEIFYSNDWDYGTRKQAEDRVHRAGQTKNVDYIDICADNTLDEQILTCLNKKERLVDSFRAEIKTRSAREVYDSWVKGRNRSGKDLS